MGPLELTTIVLLGVLLGVKWFTTVHTARLSESLTVAENDEAKFRGRYKKVEGERAALAKEIKAQASTVDAMDEQIFELEEELLEVDQRNSEIKEQLESKKR